MEVRGLLAWSFFFGLAGAFSSASLAWRITRAKISSGVERKKDSVERNISTADRDLLRPTHQIQDGRK